LIGFKELSYGGGLPSKARIVGYLYIEPKNYTRLGYRYWGHMEFF
jgi:hypothetical protein